MRKFIGWIAAALASLPCVTRAERLELAWPTPNHAWSEGRPIEAFLQPTVSGDPLSGSFGSVRSSGAQFHEGIDLKPISRDRRGEATDSVFAVLPGVVKHINLKAGDSSYGRYIVLEHPGVSPPVYTLYAHLASAAPGLKRGDPVERGQVIAQMGRSAGGYTIPKDRAHLHFEFGLVITTQFDAWYRGKKFGSPNDHGNYNGMNLMGFDPLDFFQAFRTRHVDNFNEYFRAMSPALILRIASRAKPDFTLRYPSLVTSEPPLVNAGWEIACNATGLPFRWTPLSASDLVGYRPGEVRIVETFPAMLKTMPAKNLVVNRKGQPVPGKDLQTVLEQLFGL